jgi:flagellar biosynthesis GTPase FlhF
VKPIATAIALLLGAGTLVLSSCGSSGASSVGSSATNTIAPATNGTSTGTPEGSGFSGEGCTSGPADANVRITIYGGETCAEWNRTQSSSGTFWREAQFPTSDEEQLVCSMSGPGGRTLIEVRDTGEHSYGNRICASITAEGWRETQGPGEMVEQSRKAHEAEEKAKAEQQEATERERDERRRAAENKRREEQSKRETERGEQEAKKSNEEAEKTNREDLRKSEEETKKAQREAESH